MTLLQTIDKTRPLVWFLVALVLFLSAGTGMFVVQQRTHLLGEAEDYADRELNLLGAIIAQDLIKHNFIGVRKYLAAFVKQYPDVYSIKVTAPNGFVLTEQSRTGFPEKSFTRSYCVDIEPPTDKCADIELVHDLDPIQRHISRMTKQAIVAMVFFAGFMGAILWTVLRRTAFLPLEQALADLNTTKENLELRVAQRTADWMMANKELKQEILERETVEKQVLESEAKFKSFAEQAIVGIYLIQDGKFKYCNPRFAEMFGYEQPSELMDADFLHLVHPDDITLVAERMAKRLNNEIPSTHYHFRGIRKTGEVIHLEVFGSTMDYAGKRSAIGTILDVSERVLADEALQASESKYRQVLDNINEIIYMVSLREDALLGDVVFVGGQVSSIVGIPAEAFLGDPRLWISLVHSEDMEGLRDSTKRMIRDRVKVTRNYRILNSVTGQHVWLEDKVTPQFDAAGRVIGCFGVARDVTKRRKIEDELLWTSDTQAVINRLLNLSMEDQPLDEVLRRTLEIILSSSRYAHHSMGAILLMDGDDDKLRMRVQHGLPPEILSACAVLPVGTCLCGRAAATREVQFSASVDDNHETRYPGIIPHGHYCVPILLANRTLGVLSVHLDAGHHRDMREEEFLVAVAQALGGIIERKRMEEERERMISDLRTLLDTISASRRDWQETFDSIKDMISIHDSDFTIIRANKAFAQNFGMEPRDVVDKKCYELFHHGRSPILRCPHQRALDTKEPVTEEVHDPASGRIYLMSTFPYASPESNIRGSIHIARDITEMKEKEMRLIMSERLASLGQMASGVAHEINNPLAAIAGCVDGLSRRINRGEYDPELFLKYLGIIKDEINRSKNITTSMLSVVRKSSYEKKQVNIIDAFEKALEIIGFQGRLKNVEVRRTYSADLPQVYGSEGELKQVFLILLTNALDAMDDKGILSVNTAFHERILFVDISDTGPGIAPDLRTRIFDPFFTTKSERGGTGLGLPIASRIIEAHSGSIEILTDARPGTTVRVSLPLT
ncbi:MAG: PAS domain S-box protein [Nitrospirota bacterium]|nr:PAS domain S-box protein [Nitrospirota bacterium]